MPNPTELSVEEDSFFSSTSARLYFIDSSIYLCDGHSYVHETCVADVDMCGVS